MRRNKVYGDCRMLEQLLEEAQAPLNNEVAAVADSNQSGAVCNTGMCAACTIGHCSDFTAGSWLLQLLS
jgi:hypothetical protein